MKKQYVSPEAEKVVFSYEQNVVASNPPCPGDYKFGPSNPVPDVEEPIVEEVCPSDYKF